nr:4'-phosphopantetheinyl transferase superfamily protein [uncultured Psychroserpens sp.]
MSKLFCASINVINANFDTIHIDKSNYKLFKIKLSSYYKLVPKLTNYLNDTEKLRAKKYHFDKDRNQFIITRSLLKFILAQRAGLSITNIHIEIDTNRKPYLTTNQSICFNVTHANDYALILVRDDKNVGIDVEYLNADFNFTEMLKDIYSDLEIDTVLHSTYKTHSFFKLWTRKEAIVKAIGTGISDDLPQLIALDGQHNIDPKLLENYSYMSVYTFNLNDSYIASIALCDDNLDKDDILVYELPKSIEDLVKFSNNYKT